MTQEELTQMAILKAKADKKREDKLKAEMEAEAKAAKAEPKTVIEKFEENEGAENDTPDNDVDPIFESSKAQKSEKALTYPYELVLGENKKFRFNLWTGLTKKKLRKISVDIHEEEYQTVENFSKVLDVIIYDHIDQPDMFMSEIEQQYVSLTMRALSIKDEIKYHGICPNCENIDEIETSITENLMYEGITYPKENKELDVEYIDIESKNFFEESVREYLDDPDYDELTTATDIEMAMHIKKKKPDGTEMDFKEVLEWMDQLDLKSLKIVLEDLMNCSAKLSLSSTHICSECDEEGEFKSVEMPNVFVDILT